MGYRGLPVRKHSARDPFLPSKQTRSIGEMGPVRCVYALEAYDSPF
jgi:hypothetical protein